MEQLSAPVLDRWPGALLTIVRALQSTNHMQLRAEMVQRLTVAAERSGLPELGRAAEAERAVDLITHGANAREAGTMARSVLEAAPPGETWTRARALSVLGRAELWDPDRAGYASEDELHRAALHLEEAARLFVQAGHREQAAGLAPYRALRVHPALGHPVVALEILDEALALVVERPRRTATILGYRGEVLVES